jgi:hypothetical protein
MMSGQQPANQCWACGATTAPGAAQCPTCGAAQPVYWEYHVLPVNKGIAWSLNLDPGLARELNALGRAGWELVTMTAEQIEAGTISHSLVFKRRLLQR